METTIMGYMIMGGCQNYGPFRKVHQGVLGGSGGLSKWANKGDN